MLGSVFLGQAVASNYRQFYKMTCPKGYKLKGEKTTLKKSSKFYCEKTLKENKGPPAICQFPKVWDKGHENSFGADKCKDPLKPKKFSKKGCLLGFKVKVVKNSQDLCYSKPYDYVKPKLSKVKYP